MTSSEREGLIVCGVMPAVTQGARYARKCHGLVRTADSGDPLRILTFEREPGPLPEALPIGTRARRVDRLLQYLAVSSSDCTPHRKVMCC